MANTFEKELEWTGLMNTWDRTKVGWSCYAMSNVRLEGNILEAEKGYSLQIAEVGQVGHGLGFGRFGAIEEYVAAIGSSIRVASGSVSSWTTISTGFASPWEFQQFGPDLYAVNENQGLSRHTIGGTDWSGAYNPESPSGSGMTFTERKYQFGSLPQNSLSNYFSGTWTATGGFIAPLPSIVASGDFFISFRSNATYTGTGDVHQFRMMIDFSPNVDWSFNDWIELGVKISGGNVALVSYSLNVSLVASGNTLNAISSTSQVINSKEAWRRFYFLGSRTVRTKVSRMMIDFILDRELPATWRPQDGFTLYLKLGDTYQNNNQGFTMDLGPVVTSREYRYSTFDVSLSTESNLSESSFSQLTPTGPVGASNPGSFTRVSMTTVTGGVLVSSDNLKLYRKRLSDGRFVHVGTTSNSGLPTIDDKYMEWDLESLSQYGGTSTLPTSLMPQCLGKFRGSLGVGIDYDLYLSKVSRPIEYETLNSAPDPDDFTQGRSVFVDDQRSEEVNTIKGDNVLFLGTKSKTYVMFGDYPAAYTPPRPVANVGPIGKRAATLYFDGLALLNAEGLWFIQYNDQFTSEKIGSLQTQEMTAALRTTVSGMSISSSSVLIEQRGDLFVFSGTRYLKLDREYKRWTEGTLRHSIVAAAPDRTNPMKLLTANGGLIKFHDGTSTYAGSAISWTYETGDVILPRCRITGCHIVSEGSGSLTIQSFDGDQSSRTKTYTINSAQYALTNLSASHNYGSRFRFTFAGNQNDKVKSCKFTFEYTGASDDR